MGNILVPIALFIMSAAVTFNILCVGRLSKTMDRLIEGLRDNADQVFKLRADLMTDPRLYDAFPKENKGE